MAAGLAVSAHAQTDINWVGGTSNWNSDINWSPVNIPNATMENAHLLMPAFAAVQLDVSVSINDLEVGPQITLSFDPARSITLAGDLVNNGFITLNPTVSVNNSIIQFNSNALISGNGILRLSGGSNDAAMFTNGTTVTNGVGHTIDGAGQINATLINNGVISAIETGFGNRLELISGAKTNNSTMQAGPNAELFISSITINQGPAGVIAAGTDGTVIFNGNSTINDGRIVGTGTLLKPPTGNLSLNSVSLEQDFDVAAAAGVIWTGAMFNCTSTITLNDSASISNSFIQFNTNATVTGGGSIFLAGSGNDSQVITNGTTLTIAPGFTIEGSGDIYATTVNNVVIRAFPSTNGDGRIRLFSGPKTNNSQIVADTGGIIEINGITVTQDPGGVILADGGEIALISNQTINGGTLRTMNGGTLVKLSLGNVTLVDTVIDSDLEVQAAAGVLWNGPTLDCNGTIELNDSASTSNSFIQFNTNATVTGGGSIFLAGSGNDSQVFTNGTTLTIAPDFTIEGSGDINATTVNNGLIRAFPSTNGDGRLRLVSGPKTNNSQILADTGGVIEINNITVTQAPAGEILADGGNVELIGNQTINGGSMRSINGGRLIKLPSGNLSASDLTFESDFEMEAQSGMFYNSTSLVNNATIRLNTTGSTSDVFVQFNANTVVSGIGKVLLEGSSNDSQLHTNGTTATFGTGQTLEGEGTMAGSYIIQGRLAPGLPVGRITGAASVAFEDTSIIIAETTGPGVGDGLTFSSGTITADGDVSVRLNAYVPQVNDQFNLITAGTINGLFDDVFVSAGTLPTNIAVRLVYTTSTVDVRFVCLADLAPPFGVLDLADVTGFTAAFLAQGPLADLAAPIGVFDLADINAFVVNFLGNCN